MKPVSILIPTHNRVKEGGIQEQVHRNVINENIIYCTKGN